MLLSLCLAAGQTIGLLRTTMVARLLGSEVQGQAVIIGMITGFFASVFTLNAAWQLVQSPRYDDAVFIRSLHASALIRGLAATLLIAIASTLVLYLLGYSDLIGPMLLASLVPTIEGLTNLDAWRLIRHQRFRRLAAIELSGPVSSVVAASIALALTRSVWVIPVVAIFTSVGRAAMSQLLATRPWVPRLIRSDVAEIVRFSLPLLPAGVLFWLNSQSDRIVIMLGDRVSWLEQFDLRDLGAYGTVAMIVVLPSGTIVKTMQSIVVPRISASRESADALRLAFHRCWWPMLVLCIATLLAGSTIGVWLLGLLIGPDYQPGLAVLGVLVGAMSIQLIRHLCYSASTGLGTTTTILFGNCLRTSGILLAGTAAGLHLGLNGLAWSVLIAELLATLGAGVWLGRRLPGAVSRVTVAVLALGLLSWIFN